MVEKITPQAREYRRTQVEYLLIAGVPFRQIAERLGVNKNTVLADSKAIRAGWAQARTEAYDRYAAEELVRLAALQRAVWVDAMTGDIKAVGMALRISDLRCRLLGLYAPLHVDVQDERLQSKSDFDREVTEFLARLDAADAAAMQAEADALLPGDESRREGLNGQGS